MAGSQHHVSKRLSTRQNGIRSPQKLLMLLAVSLLHLGMGAAFDHNLSAQEQVPASPPTTSTSNPLRHSPTVHYNVSVPSSELNRGVAKEPTRKEETCFPRDRYRVKHVSVLTECRQLLLNFNVADYQIPQDEMLLIKKKFLVGNVSLSVGNVSTIINESYMCQCYARELGNVTDDTCVLSVNFNESERFILDNHKIESVFSPSRASTIKALSLRNNNIYNLSLNLFDHFLHLEVLDLSQNMFDNLNFTQVHFPHLIKLELSNNKLRLFDSSPCNLTSLNIAHNDITDLSFISKFKNIVILRASHNSIESIPSSILNSTELRCIDLSHNKIKDVALLQRSSLKNVYSISLSHNEIEQVNIDFRNHTLKLLLLSNNNISYFNFIGAQRLVYLDLCNNRISKIEPTHPLLDSSVTGLKLCNNLLTDAFVITLMDGLQTLDLSNNNIPNLHKMIFHKNYLRKLYLSNVSLTSLEFVKNLTALQELQVDDNKITHFPENIIQTKMETLSLSNNPFKPVYCPFRRNEKEIIGNCNMSYRETNDHIILNIGKENKEVNNQMGCVLNNKSGKEFLNQCSSNSSFGKKSLTQYLLLLVIFILNVFYYEAIDVF